MIIAIDGPAASGKSTTARRVAEILDYIYIDTGAMYRAATLAVHRAGIGPGIEDEVAALVAEIDVSFGRDSDGRLCTMLDGEDVSVEIRTPSIAADVSLISSYPAVRERMVGLQREIAQEGGVVLDGRDIGTVVFPRADVKIFLVADLDARARRRTIEQTGSSRPSQSEVDRMAGDLAERDRKDSSRAASPLRKADDAIEIDTSGLSIDEQVSRVLAIVRERSASTAE